MKLNPLAYFFVPLVVILNTENLFAIEMCMPAACNLTDEEPCPANCLSCQCSECLNGIPGRTITCTACKSGYTLSGNNCILSCSGCTNCNSDTNWSAHATGYEKKTTKTCDCNTCKSSTSYRCAAGYYGNSTNGSSGCTICPDGGTSAAGSVGITNCYIFGGSDETGNYTYTDKCYYEWDLNPIMPDF